VPDAALIGIEAATIDTPVATAATVVAVATVE
jgi:hypothetical protein